jgi:NAD(P)-dependent dehydrogenase (short-subunit alcohol dehydrogenase family)
MTSPDRNTALIVGASRSLGLALATEYARLGWHVIGTARAGKRTGLHDLADSGDGQVTVETLDMTDQRQVAALRERLAGTRLDMVFVNAAITHGNLPVGEVSTESFVEVMVTNALSPMRVVETFRGLVPPDGTIGVMSSRQGSISLNATGGHEVYRASKSALNQLMRSYAARNAADSHTLLLVNPGHVRTELGGPDAKLNIEDSIPGVVKVIEAHRGRPGLHFVDYQGNIVPW